MSSAAPVFGESPGLDVQAPTGKKAKRLAKRAKPRNNVLASGLGYGSESQGLPDVGSRDAYAAWMTSPDNPRFTRAIVNRLWKLAMGRGLVEPVDDWRDDTVPSNPELLDRLADLMVELDYDVRQFLRVLHLTDTWQREAPRDEPAMDEPYLFPGPLLRRMTAEQMWDSMLTLVVPDVDGSLADVGAFAEPVYEEYDAFLGQSPDELRELVEVQQLRFTDPTAFKRAMAAQKASRSKRGKEARKLVAALRKAERRGKDGEVAELRAELEQMGLDPDQPLRNVRKKADALVRASDLPSPAPEDHFLRMFGQSDREQIDASHTDANVPQVLALLNGFVEEHVLVPGSALSDALKREDEGRARIRAAWLWVLGREPTPRELDLWKSDLARHGNAAMEDLVWTLVNSHEFRFVR